MNKVEWKETKQKIKAKFKQLTDLEIEELDGHIDQLQSKIKHAYAYTEEEAKAKYEAFKKSTMEVS